MKEVLKLLKDFFAILLIIIVGAAVIKENFLSDKEAETFLESDEQFEVSTEALRMIVNERGFLKNNPEYIAEVRKTDSHHIVTVTVYNPVPEQCDSDPLITADGSQIDTVKLRAGKLKWCAVSQDLRSKYPYGSEITVYVNKKPERYVVHDTMSPKWTNRVDLLKPTAVKTGSWRNVLVTSDNSVVREI